MQGDHLIPAGTGQSRAGRLVGPLLEMLPAACREYLLFYWFHKRLPRLDPPTTFNDWIVHRKLRERNTLYQRLADKLAVREYVRDNAGAHYLPELHGVLDSAQELLLCPLPPDCVLKATHDSDSTVLLPDSTRVSRTALARHFRRSLARQPARITNEWWYRAIPPRILIEDFLGDNDKRTPNDYKFFVFRGEVALIQVDYDRFGEHRRTLYTPEWQALDCHFGVPRGIPRRPPANLDEMLSLARRLACTLDFARVDLYSIHNETRAIFGEITLAPMAGYRDYGASGLDEWLGRQWGTCVEAEHAIA